MTGPSNTWTMSPPTHRVAAPGALRLRVEGVRAARSAGIDLVDIARLGLAAARTGPALERRLCSTGELAVLASDPPTRLRQLARLFSIKESALKAIGGIPRGGRWTDMCTGAPVADGRVVQIGLTGAVAERAEELGVRLVAGAATPEAAGTDPAVLLSWVLAVPAGVHR